MRDIYVLLLYLEKAFDEVSQGKMIKSNKKTRNTREDRQRDKDVTTAPRQGCPLSPHLFTYHADDGY